MAVVGHVFLCALEDRCNQEWYLTGGLTKLVTVLETTSLYFATKYTSIRVITCYARNVNHVSSFVVSKYVTSMYGIHVVSYGLITVVSVQLVR